MAKRIHIRNMSELMFDALRAWAAEEGMSMNDYLKRMIERDLKRPSWADMVKRMDALEPVALPVSTADIVRRERDSR